MLLVSGRTEHQGMLFAVFYTPATAYSCVCVQKPAVLRGDACWIRRVYRYTPFYVIRRSMYINTIHTWTHIDTNAALYQVQRYSINCSTTSIKSASGTAAVSSAKRTTLHLPLIHILTVFIFPNMLSFINQNRSQNGCAFQCFILICSETIMIILIQYWCTRYKFSFYFGAE